MKWLKDIEEVGGGGGVAVKCWHSTTGVFDTLLKEKNAFLNAFLISMAKCSRCLCSINLELLQ